MILAPDNTFREPHDGEEGAWLVVNGDSRVSFRGFVLDHNHRTGRYRAWVCIGCNQKIAMYEHPFDFPAEASLTEDYLRRHDEDYVTNA